MTYNVFGGTLSLTQSVNQSGTDPLSSVLCLLTSVMWHPSGDSSTFITLADSHILVCDVEPSGSMAKVCGWCCGISIIGLG